MGCVTYENLRAMLNKRKIKFVRPVKTPDRGVTADDVSIAEEWFARLPQSLLEDSDQPILAGELFEIARKKYGSLKPADIGALKQAAYDLMIDKICETLNTYVEHESEGSPAKGRK